MKIVLNLKHSIFVILFLIPFVALKAQSGNIEFVENKGQWDQRVKFQGKVKSGAFFVRGTGGFTVLQHNQDDLSAIQDYFHYSHNSNISSAKTITNKDLVLRSHSYNVDFVGASPSMEIVPDKAAEGYNNYFIGSDPSKWAANCKIYQGVTVKNIYPNVDVRYYTQGGTMKYDIIVRPGADVSKIALKYEGVKKIGLQKKELLVETSLGNVKELAPYTYQVSSKERKDLECKYVVKDNIVKFQLKNYDPAATIIIDPTLVFISFSKSVSDNWGFTATYGPDGSMFGGGIVYGAQFPVSPGAFQETYGGGQGNNPFDIGIIKLSPTGSTRQYATYIGGSKGDEQPHSLIVDGNGNLVLAGRTNSDDYPVTGTGTIGPCGSYDIVVTKLNATGTALLGSKRIGGRQDDGVNITISREGPNSLQINYGDDGRSEVILDAAGNIYVASCTQSDDFPANNGFNTTLNGRQDGVVLKFPPDVSTLTFGTYLGGTVDDAAYVLSLSPNGNIYVGGATNSQDFPGVPAAGVIKSTNNDAIDGFVSIIANNGSALISSTYLGTTSTDAVYGLKFDNKGFPYVMGQTYGAWPVINAAYVNAGAKQFIAKLQPNLSAFVYSTTFGKSSATPSISPVAFLVDRCENVYVSGWGGHADKYVSSGTSGMPVTGDAFQPTSIDNQDFYFFVLQRDAASQLYGSFLGENGDGFPDHVDGGTSRFDQNGVIYQAICGNCVPIKGSNPPRKPVFPRAGTNVWSPVNASERCNLVMVKIAFDLAGVSGGLQASINGVPKDTAGCIPLTVDFRDTVRKAKLYKWDFGDGSPAFFTTSRDTSHTYTAVGNYLVTLIAIDSTTCNISDTVYTHIRAGDNRATVDFNFAKLDPCEQFRYQFNNLSVPSAGIPFTNRSFVWDFGDNTAPDTTGNGTVFHNYTAPGSYRVTLSLIDTSYCNAPEVIDTILGVAALVQANFNIPPTGCAPYTAVFDNTSLAGQTFQWDFGDGSPVSTDFEPTHLYNIPGQYTIRLTAFNDFTCNRVDDTTITISVYGKPQADFSYTPVTPVENTPNVFTNNSSSDAVSFVWHFGDGDSLVTTSRAQVIHQYNATGTFDACLVAINVAGCADSICKPVETIINPVVAVPNAFTPNSNDINSRIAVRGFGIAKMRFIIWNRWGQKVFETNDQNIGWDGKFKGALQPMDVYAYTLEVQFFDGTKTTKKGDITLIR